MASITFTNSNSGIVPGFNPGLEDVLDPGGTITQATAGMFEITNTHAGPFNGFKVQLTSSASDFTYYFIATEPPIFTNTPSSGKIDGITLRAPNGTVILEVTAGSAGFGTKDLVEFNNRIFNLNHDSPKDAIFDALDHLLGRDNLVLGSGIADHATAFGSGTVQLLGGGGNDLLWSPGAHSRSLVGGAGNDLLRVEDGNYDVHGANGDGTGGASETNTVEVVGYVNDSSNASFGHVTNINVLRFVAGDQPAAPSVEGASMQANFEAGQIGAGHLSATLAVDGSTAASPFSNNYLEIFTEYDNTATTGVNIDLSGWTFTHWNEAQNEVGITTNQAPRALNDTVVGTMVADEIVTYAGNDTLRGGGGADELYGDVGSDTFVYGLHEAVARETVSGGEETVGGGDVDRVLVLADNDFTGVEFVNIEQFVFAAGATAIFSADLVDVTTNSAKRVVAAAPTIVGDSHGNTIAFQLERSGGHAPSIDLIDVAFLSWGAKADKVVIKGTTSRDEIAGSSEGDIIRGGEGSDFLVGNKGHDVFVFDTGFRGIDHIADFSRAEHDSIELDNAIFKKLKPGVLSKAAFTIGSEAHDKSDRLIYDREDCTLRYDNDGTGKHLAHIFAVIDDTASLKAGDFLVI